MKYAEKKAKVLMSIRKVDIKERNEERFFKSIMLLLGLLLFLFLILIFLKSSNNSEKELVESVNIEKNSDVKSTLIDNDDLETLIIRDDVEEDINSDVSSSRLNEKEKSVKRANILSLVKEKKIVHVTSLKPDGFYIIIGMFSEYDNAVNLKINNLTKFDCYIFEADESNMYRVGLFISENDYDKAREILSRIKNMEKGSWILYNSKN